LQSAINTTEAFVPDQLLEAPPEIDETLLNFVEPPKSILLYILKGAFSFLAVVGVGSMVFFTSQLTNYFNFLDGVVSIPSVLNDIDASNEQLKTLQTDYNMYRFLQGKLYLDRFSYDGDEFVKNYYIYSNTTGEDAERTQAKEAMDALRPLLIESFAKAKENLIGKTQDIKLVGDQYVDFTDVDFKNMFSALLNERLTSESEKMDDKIEQKLYKRTQKLIDNTVLIDILNKSDLSGLDDLGLAKLIVSVNDTVVNELSSIQKIKDSRINWSEVIKKIELETAVVDKYFSKDFYDQIGGIQYTSYDFDTATNKIGITGTTKRFTTDNFTLISNLIDQLNDSVYFKGVEMPSFSKSGSSEGGYTATLRLNLELKREALREKDTGKDIESFPEFLKDTTNVPVTQ